MAGREAQALGHDADARDAHLAPDPLDSLLADGADEVGDDALRLIFIACHPKLAREFGALRILECWGEDVPVGKLTDSRRAVQATADETVVFRWVE